jgi:hypothetical protein
VTGPDELRARFAGHTPATLAGAIAALRPRPGDAPGYATRVALREPGRRVQFPDAACAENLIHPGGSGYSVSAQAARASCTPRSPLAAA